MQILPTSAVTHARGLELAQAARNAAGTSGTNGSNSTGSTSSTSTANSVGSLTSEQTFLQLLIAQIQNQDPLNPTDSIQFVGQLVQYSELEQLMGINQGVQSLNGGSTSTTSTSGTSTTPASGAATVTPTNAAASANLAKALL
jgi:flagellar basal-body rod modification protein FlgD